MRHSFIVNRVRNKVIDAEWYAATGKAVGLNRVGVTAEKKNSRSSQGKCCGETEQLT